MSSRLVYPLLIASLLTAASTVTPPARASSSGEDTTPSDTGLPDQSREALRELVGQGTPPRMVDRRPGILGPPTEFPTGENAAYYMDEVKLQPGEPAAREAPPENATATPGDGDGAADVQR